MSKHMAGVQSLGSRKSILGWFLIGLAALSKIADLEGFIQFGQRVGLPDWHLPIFLPWALADYARQFVPEMFERWYPKPSLKYNGLKKTY